MTKCIKCGSYAFNLYKENIDQGGFCDVHYWQGRAHRAEALAQPAQGPPQWWPAVENILTEYGLQAIDFVADFKAALAQPEQEPVVCKHEWFRTGAMEPRECRCIKCGAWNTTSPQRTWVDPTDDEIQVIAKKARSKDHAVTLTGRLLKEKNFD